MLTDYHVHLRPDERENTPERFFTRANAERYREAAAEHGIDELGVAEHVYRFSQALDVWEHPFWRTYAVDDLDGYCAFVREDTDLKLGIEADYIPGREDRMANLLDARDWDFVVGSIHFVGDQSLDTEEFSIWTETASAERIWQRYFEMLGQAAQSGLFDILAHPDLVKVWGEDRPIPDGDLRRFYYPAMEVIADCDVAIEVSTAGFRKPVQQIYPAPEFLEMAIDAGKPLALSSDAHVPEQLGHEYERALELLDSVGVKEIAVFENRTRRMEPLG
ncbi:MAG TPA: histidinol-phosphatase HisJ family protein [Thermoleophilaceae bacterium]|nr:histidinol-phosphatase HisJ family protein [Thermoleophilaceae bacterium]